jgi:hypothetical protein
VTHLKAEVHTGIWTAFMTNLSGATGYWWWNLIDAEDLYSHYRALAAFAKGEDRRGKQYYSDFCDVLAEGVTVVKSLSNTGARTISRPDATPSSSAFYRRAICLHNKEELFAYVYCSKINENSTSTPAKGFDDPAFPLSGHLRLCLPVKMTPGTYSLSFWNTFTGDVILEKEIRLAPDQKVIPLLGHRVDLALKLKKIVGSGQ